MTADGDARGSACCCCTTGFTAAMGLVPGVRLVLGPDTWLAGGTVAVLAEADPDLDAEAEDLLAEDRKLVMDCCCCPGFFDLLPLPLFNIFNTDSFYIINLFCKESTLIITHILKLKFIPHASLILLLSIPHEISNNFISRLLFAWLALRLF